MKSSWYHQLLSKWFGSVSCGGDCEQGRKPCNCNENSQVLVEKSESLDWPVEKNSVYQNGNLEGNNH